MSDTFSFLAYLEASEANSRLRELESHEADKASERKYEKIQALEKELVFLLQALYNNNNNVASLDLSKVSDLETHMYSSYMNKAKNRIVKLDERRPKIVIGILFIVMILILMAVSKIWIKATLALIVGYFILNLWRDVLSDRKRYKAYNEHTNRYKENMIELKQRFPDLTAWGVYLKYFIDNRCKDVVVRLNQNGEYGNPEISLEKLYTLFELNADTSFDYSGESIGAMNYDLIHIFDNLNVENTQYIPLEAGTKEQALERAKSMYPGSKFKEFHDHWKKDRDVVLAAVTNHPAALEFADDEFKKDKEIVLATLSNAGFSGGLRYANEFLKKDKEIVKAFIERSAFNIDDADLSLKKDKDFVMQLLTDSNCNNGHALKYVDDSLKNDKEIVLAAVNITGDALEYASDDLKSDKEVVLAALTSHGDSYKFVDKSLKNDPDVLLAAKEQSTLEESIEQYEFQQFCSKHEEMNRVFA